MDRITHAKRLQQLFEEMKELGQNDETVNKSSMLIAATLKSPEFKGLWCAARHCLAEIEKAHKTCPRFDESTREAMRRALKRLTAALSDEAFMKNFQTFRQQHLNERMDDDLANLNAFLVTHKVYELIGDEEVAELSQHVTELKERLMASDLDDRLKLSLSALLSQMEHVFETYHLLGEQNLDDVSTQWAGTLMKFHEEFKSTVDVDLKEQSFGLLFRLWKAFEFGGNLIGAVDNWKKMIGPPAA